MHLRQIIATTTRMKIPPNTISRISHHAIRSLLTTTTEVDSDVDSGVDSGVDSEEGVEESSVEVLVGTDIGVDEDETVDVVLVVVVEFITCTNSERQTPKPGTTFDDPVQFADIQDPARRTWVGSEHDKQSVEPGPAQLEQLEWQVLHVELFQSKNWDWAAHVFTQRPFKRTGLVGKHAVHWLKEGPEQSEQSG